MRRPDVDQQPPFIVAFEPQSDLLVVRQGTVELNELTIDDVTCGSQILSIFFYYSRGQAFEAQHALSRSLNELQTVYDVFRSTRVLEILEQAIGSAHIPLEIVANRMDIGDDKPETSKIEGELSIAHEGIESYSIRMAVSQGLNTVTPETDLIGNLRDAVTKKGSNVNRISLNFYKLTNTKIISAVQTPANVTTPYILRRSGKSTPRNVTRATTPCARAGKAVVDLYSKRGLINPPTSWTAGPQYKNVLVAASPVLKAAVSSQELAEALEQSMENLRSVSQDHYVAADGLQKQESLEVEEVQQEVKEILLPSHVDDTQDVEDFNFANAMQQSSDRTHDSGVSNAVDLALKLFDMWKFNDFEVVNIPEPTIQIPKSSARRISIVSDHNNGHEDLGEGNDIQEVPQLETKTSAIETKLREELNAVKLQHERETSKLNEALREKDEIIANIVCANDSERVEESRIMVKELNKQLDSVVMEKDELLKQVQAIKEEKDNICKELELLKGKDSEAMDLEKTINQLKTDQEDQMIVMRRCISKLQKEKGEISNDLNKYKHEQRKLIFELDNAKNLEKQLKDSISKYEHTAVHVTSMEDELKMSKSTIAKLEESIMHTKLREEQLVKELTEAKIEKEDLRSSLERATLHANSMQEELEAEHVKTLQLNQRIKDIEATNVDLENKIDNVMAREDKLKHDKSQVADKYLKEKLKHDTLINDHEMRCKKLSNHVKELNIKLDMVVHKYDRLSEKYALDKVKASLKIHGLEKQINYSKQLNGNLINTVLRSKAELARKRCNLRAMAHALHLSENATEKQIVSELMKPKVLDPVIKQKLTNYERLKASYTKLKAENDEQAKVLEMKTNCYKKYVQRHDSLQDENRRLSTTLAQERDRLVAMEVVAKKQVKTELAKTNEEKRMLYAKQCELMMQNEGLKQENDGLKQRLAMSQINSIESKGSDKSGRLSNYSSIDANNLVMDKLNKMRTVFYNSDVKGSSLKCRISDTTIEDDASVRYSRSIDLEEHKSIEKSVPPTSPCAYRDTKASLYSRRATWEKIRTRQLRNDERLESLFGANTYKQKPPWVY